MNVKSLISGIVLFWTLCVSTAFADDAENIEACVQKAKEFASVKLDEFDANYEGSWLQNDVAKWDNAVCEVTATKVYNLNIEGKNYIYRGFSGEESYKLNEMLEETTQDAISILRSRVSLLEKRMENVTTKLKLVNPDHQDLVGYIKKGVDKAL
jgi:hypothetical protein